MSLDTTPDAEPTEVRVATGARGEKRIEFAMNRLLHLMREELKMDVAFVAEFVGGQRLLRHVDVGPGGESVVAGLSQPVEDTLCQRVIDGRLPS
ncbi:MAG: hypothetical protein EOO24_62295, partial [Comamonadaceae bacterium]